MNCLWKNGRSTQVLIFPIPWNTQWKMLYFFVIFLNVVIRKHQLGWMQLPYRCCDGGCCNGKWQIHVGSTMFGTAMSRGKHHKRKSRTAFKIKHMECFLGLFFLVSSFFSLIRLRFMLLCSCSCLSETCFFGCSCSCSLSFSGVLTLQISFNVTSMVILSLFVHSNLPKNLFST